MSLVCISEKDDEVFQSKLSCSDQMAFRRSEIVDMTIGDLISNPPNECLQHDVFFISVSCLVDTYD